MDKSYLHQEKQDLPVTLHPGLLYINQLLVSSTKSRRCSHRISWNTKGMLYYPITLYIYIYIYIYIRSSVLRTCVGSFLNSSGSISIYEDF